MNRSHLFALVALALVVPPLYFRDELPDLGWALLAGLVVGVVALALGGLGVLAVKRASAAHQGGALYADGCSTPRGLSAAVGGVLKGGTWGSWHTCVHEAGHHGVGEWQGNRCRSVVGKERGGGGFCRLLRGWFRSPVDNIAFLLGGQMAAGTSWGDWGDNDMIKAWLKSYPAAEQDQRLREAEQKARRGLAATAGYRARIAEILHQTGTFG